MSQCNYIVGIEDEETWDKYNRETVDILPDTTGMSAYDAYTHAYSRIMNLVLGPEYFKPLAQIIINSNDAEYALYWARIFHEDKNRPDKDYFIDDMKNIVMSVPTYENLLRWALDVCIYDDDIMKLFYHSVINVIDNKYTIDNLTYLTYIGVLKGNDFLNVRRHIALNGVEYAKHFVETYNKYTKEFSQYDNYKHLDSTPMTIESFYKDLS